MLIQISFWFRFHVCPSLPCPLWKIMWRSSSFFSQVTTPCLEKVVALVRGDQDAEALPRVDEANSPGVFLWHRRALTLPRNQWLSCGLLAVGSLERKGKKEDRWFFLFFLNVPCPSVNFRVCLWSFCSHQVTETDANEVHCLFSVATHSGWRGSSKWWPHHEGNWD